MENKLQQLFRNSIYQLEEIHICFDGENYWIIDNILNCIFKADKSLNTVDFISYYPEKYRNKANHSFGNVIKIEKELYLIPISAEDIYIYDIESKEYTKLGVNFSDLKGISLERISIVPFYYDGKLLCINRKPDYVIAIDVQTKGIEYYDISNHKYSDDKQLNMVYRNTFMIGRQNDYLIIPYLSGNVVIYFNLVTGEYSVDKIEIEVAKDDYICGYCSVNYSKGYVYTKKGLIAKIEFDDFGKKISVNQETCIDLCSENEYLVNVFYNNENLWIVKSHDIDIYCYSLIDKKIEKIRNDFIIVDKRLEEFYTYAILADDAILCGSEADGYVTFYVDMISKSLKPKNISMSPISRGIIKNKNLYNVDNLSEFLEIIIS